MEEINKKSLYSAFESLAKEIIEDDRKIINRLANI